MQQSSLPKICLNMIVKNEAHVIQETLASVSKFINYYVICDTGSTDNTEEVIRTYFDSIGISGEIKHHDWRDNFGYSRSRAIKECLGKSEYIWIIDADDIIVGDLILPPLVDHAYALQIGQGFVYNRPFIIKNDESLGWHFRMPVHEYLRSVNPTNEAILIKGDYYLDSRRLGDRSKNPNKYLKDAIILKNFLPEAGEDYNRTYFYLANSYFDHSCMNKSVEHMILALETYRERIKLQGWYEEVYYSWYRIVNCIIFLIKLQVKDYGINDMIDAGVQGQTSCKERVESMTDLIKYLNSQNKFKTAYKYAKMAFGDNLKSGFIPLPVHSKLFIHETMFTHELAHEFVFSAINVGKYIEAEHVINGTLKQYSSKMPLDWNNIFNANRQACMNYFNKPKTQHCLLYLGSCIRPELNKIIKYLKMQYNIYIIMDTINRGICDHKNIIFITPDALTDIRKKIKFNQIYLFDNVNLLLHKTFKSFDLHTTLIMLTPGLTTYSDDGTSININNALMLSNLSTRINQIYVTSNSTLDAVASYYNISKSNIYNVNENLVNLFERKYSKYAFEVNKEDYDPYTNGISINYLENYIFIDTQDTSAFYDKLSTYYTSCVDTCKDLKHALNYHKYKNIINNTIDYASDLKKIEEYVEKNKNEISKISWNMLKTELLIKSGNHSKALSVLNNICKTKIDHLFLYPNDTYLEELREKCLNALKNESLVYPTKLIENITKNTNNVSPYNIILTMTTCKRIDLFEKTMNSFINSCLDINLINSWFIVDDNSSESDRKKMKALYPFVNFVHKTPEQRGHYYSMKIIYDHITSNNFDYVIHMEDDFHFIDKKFYVGNSLKILTSNDAKQNNYAQVLFNRNYAEIFHSDQPINGGILKYIDKLDYIIVHEHYAKGTEEYDNFNKRVKGSNCMYWPHYSFRPSMISIKVLKDIGPYTNSIHFEMQYAKEYNTKGYKSVFFNGVNCLHIGKKTWEKDVNTPNAYALNSQDQFGKGSNQVGLYVATYDNVISPSFKIMINNTFDDHQIKGFYINTNDFVIGSDFSYKKYAGNNFNYFDKIIKYNETILKILGDISKSQYKYAFVLQDTIIDINKEMIDKLISKLNDIHDDSIVLLSTNSKTDDITIMDSNEVTTLNNFLISKHAVDKLLNNLSYPIMCNVCDNLVHVPEITYYGYNVIKETTIDHVSSIQQLKEGTELQGYTFYSKLDSFGNDITYYNLNSLADIKEYCDKDSNAKGFNTLGWVKHTILPEEELIALYKANKYTDGLYIKNS